MSHQGNTWEREYRNPLLVTKNDSPQADTLRFLKFLKKEQKFRVEEKVILDLGCGTGRNSNYLALFGLLIAPLAWIAATVPGAAAIGIAGIGATPALLALFLYSLLPVVANTVAGLDGVPPEAEEAARGMGMTDGERLRQIELPLAFPVILTGIRIVLVQNIGLATVAALIGGGGFGVFVFQGIGQTALDLVLLGAVPTVALAFAAGAILDAVVEMVTPGARA